MKLQHSGHVVFYSKTISYNYEMKLSIYNNETTSYNYEMKLIRVHIFMKEFIALLKNKILPDDSEPFSCCQKMLRVVAVTHGNDPKFFLVARRNVTRKS